MGWVKLDDQFPDHRKIAALGHEAFRLHVVALCWCASQLTDGALRTPDVDRLRRREDLPAEAVFELVGAGLWDPTDDGYAIHDYLDWNPSADLERKRKAAGAERQRKSRERRGHAAASRPSSHVTDGVTSDVTTCDPYPSPTTTRDELVDNALLCHVRQVVEDEDDSSVKNTTAVARDRINRGLFEAVRAELADLASIEDFSNPAALAEGLSSYRAAKASAAAAESEAIRLDQERERRRLQDAEDERVKRLRDELDAAALPPSESADRARALRANVRTA